MLDIVTARVVLSVVAFAVFVLFMFGTYRRTRSRYAWWWAIALLASGAGTAAYFFNDTALQVVFNPLGNVLGVVGTGGVWFAARSVAGKGPAWRVEAVIVAAVALAAYLDDPSHDEWTGGPVLLLGMAANLALTARESGVLLRDWRRGPARAMPDRFATALMSMLLASGGLALFYLVRLVGYVAWGPGDPRFEAWLGPGITTLALVLTLVVATFSVTSVSYYESASEVRRRAAYDGLTGVLTRAEFLDRAELWRKRRGNGSSVMMVDLDHFKELNDALGHEAGDRALQAFGAAVTAVLSDQGLCGRMGGEEFAILLDTVDTERAQEVAREISARYAEISPLRLGTPTASYGLTVAYGHEAVADALARADAALYRAKATGRDRLVVDVMDAR